jgi:hypothetical protein
MSAYVQTGTKSLTLQSDTVTIAAVDLSRSFLSFSYETASGGSGCLAKGAIKGELTNTTTITFDRDEPSVLPTVDIYWQVVQFVPGVNVQQVTFTGDGTSQNQDATITAVDLTKAYVFNTYKASGSIWNDEDLSAAQLTSSTNLRWASGGVVTPCAHAANQRTTMFVVECPSCTVQQVTKTLNRLNTTDTVTISTVDPAHSMVYGQYTTVEKQSYNYSMQYVWRITDSTTVSFLRQEAMTALWNYDSTWYGYVVSFTDGTTVQRSDVTINSGDTSGNTAISSVNTNNAFCKLQSIFNTFGAINSTNVGTTDDTLFKISITSSTNLAWLRAASGTSGILAYEVVDYGYGAQTSVVWIAL